MNLTVSSDLVLLVLDPDAAEEGLQDLPFRLLPRRYVETVGPGEEIEVRQDCVGLTLRLVLTTGELVEKGSSLHGDRAEPFLHRAGGELAVRGDVQKVRLLRFKLSQLSGQAPTNSALRLLSNIDRVPHMLLHQGHEVLVEAELLHLAGNGALNVAHG
ncbi:hypothetical protein LQ938_11415 [Microbacterium sp. cx-55]|uniref:hypothetical protein n=1 Tax=Microbacterium sp. cx-55 TaxID=2875948 RepID=UPI001CBEA568|nr:hypothetical protein [Microbacterium sp. cx-55]MBZ4488115.1 hypothetical protein [Microbacterium sp. cx-55]UGB34475.1 hypothetical protein LQ938_11415 [Microbacterium sp. cx-55]